MNKIVVGNTPSPNIKKVQSKVGSMANAAHKVSLKGESPKHFVSGFFLSNFYSESPALVDFL